LRPNPLILGFDTSAAHCAAALLSDGQIIAAKHEDMAKGQAERLMVLCEEVLAEAGVTWADLDALGVGIGPGNFTGIRISVAAARGLSMGLGVPAVGINLLDALALGTDGPVLTCLDARRETAYVQGFGGAGPAEITHVALAQIDPAWMPEGTVCTGSVATQIEALYSIPRRPSAFAPASAIARLAAQRFGPDTPAPSPLYMRAPDAAPSKMRGPVMLP